MEGKLANFFSLLKSNIEDRCRFIDTEIVEKDGFFDIFYLLEEPGTYDVDVKFGGKQVPNGLMRMTVK